MTFTVPLTILMLAVSGLEAVVTLTQEKSVAVSLGSNGAVQGRGHPGVPGPGLPPGLADRDLDGGRRRVAGGDVRTGEAQRRSDGTYSASSLLTLTADRWRSGRSYACQLTHPALTAPLSQALTQAECASQG
ncbi:hypothetical protein ANANG_G00118870 [Anguilla anguilla]|uniref:Immunoglobulin C1-set domain-containing protein n=1 Tax=Anguilla anguilla TaxID=7936 RepID=A0A9D3MGG6_ANGAN|nr:hypothetical protein ANANG_G00118870 [Anguilla anguilla]